MIRGKALAAVLPVLMWTTIVPGQPPPSTAPLPPASATAEAKPAAPAEAVAVTVNNHPIMAAEVEKMFEAIVREQAQGRALPPDQTAQLRDRLGPQILDTLIDNRLLDEDVERAQITVTGEHMRTEMEKILGGHLVRSATTRAEFEKRLQERTGAPLEEFLSERAADPDFRQAVLHAKLLEKKFPEDLAVSDDAIQARYQADLDNIYSKPALVRASHVLIGVESAASPEQKTAARQQAETVVEQARQPGADFTALALQHSTCPSRSQGGDLGFFPRDGVMVEPFAAAAFALNTGEISGVVETDFGYHVIKVTERKDASVVPLDQASATIRDELKDQKIADLKQRHGSELRKSAKIVYPDATAPTE